MMWLLVWISYALLFAFSTICLASGLYYLAELVEEYSTLSRKVLRYTILSVIALHVVVWLFEDNFPLLYILLSIGAHVSYYQLLKDFPFVSFTDLFFILSCVLGLVNHFVWFRFFTQEQWFQFNEVVAFFLIFVWLVPFFFFISIAANDNALPYTISPITASASSDGPLGLDNAGTRKRGRRVNMLLSFFKFLRSKKSLILPDTTTSISVKDL